MKRREVIGMLIGGGILGGAIGGILKRFGMRQQPEPMPAARRELGDDFFYDIDRFLEVDPDLIGYRSAQLPLPLEMQRPLSFALRADGGSLVAGDNRWCWLDAAGVCHKEHQVKGNARCLRIVGQEVWCTVDDHVEHYGIDGKRYAVWEPPAEQALLTAVDAADEHVFAADAANRTVWHYDPSGKLLGRLGNADANRYQVPSPYFDLRIGQDGLLRVVNPGKHKIELWTLDGQLELSWGKTSMGIEGFSGCCNPVSIALLPDGRCVTAEKGLPRIKIYSAHGDFETVVAAPSDFPDLLNAGNDGNASDKGLVVDAAPDGTIYALDPAARNLRRFFPV